MLPSFLYAPLEGERAEDPFGDAPWAARRARAPAGRRGRRAARRLEQELARARGGRPDGGHPAVGRRRTTSPKVSPVEAAARLLAHVGGAWDAAHPDAPLAEQEVVLTVPASFDEVARELTVEAAQRAGLVAAAARGAAGRVLRLDGALRGRRGCDACSSAHRRDRRSCSSSTWAEARRTCRSCAWRASQRRRARRRRAAPAARRRQHGPRARPRARAAAGRRRGKLDRPASRSSWPHAATPRRSCSATRRPKTCRSRWSGAGAQPRRGRAHAPGSSREEAERVVLEGFLPAVDAAGARPQRARSALVGFGLPYERDVAITRHVAALRRAGTSPDGRAGRRAAQRRASSAPRASPTRVVERRSRRWRGEPADAACPTPIPDLAVARGAVGLRARAARAGRAHRRRLGARLLRRRRRRRGQRRRSASSLAAPRRACPHGARGRTFALASGRPVRFDLSRATRSPPRAGRRRRRRRRALRARCRRSRPRSRSRRGQAGEVRVVIEGELTPVGHARPRVRRGRSTARRRRAGSSVQLAAPPVPAAPSSSPGSDDQSVRPAVAVRSPPRRLDARASSSLDRAFGKPRADATRPRGQGSAARARDACSASGRSGRPRPTAPSSTRSSPSARGAAALGRPRAHVLAARGLVRPAGLRRSARPGRVAALFAALRRAARFPGRGARLAAVLHRVAARRGRSRRGRADAASATSSIRTSRLPRRAQEAEEAGAVARRRARHGVVARAGRADAPRASSADGSSSARGRTATPALGGHRATGRARSGVRERAPRRAAARRGAVDRSPAAREVGRRAHRDRRRRGAGPADRRPGARRQRSRARRKSRSASGRGGRDARARCAPCARSSRSRPASAPRSSATRSHRPASRRVVLFRRGTSRAPGSGARFLIWGGLRDSETACGAGGWDRTRAVSSAIARPKSRNGHPTPGRSSWHFGGPLRDSSGVVAGRVAWRPSYRETRRVQRLLEMAHHRSRRVHRWWVSLSSSAAGASEATATEARDRRSR